MPIADDGVNVVVAEDAGATSGEGRVSSCAGSVTGTGVVIVSLAAALASAAVSTIKTDCGRVIGGGALSMGASYSTACSSAGVVTATGAAVLCVVVVCDVGLADAVDTAVLTAAGRAVYGRAMAGGRGCGMAEVAGRDALCCCCCLRCTQACVSCVSVAMSGEACVCAGI